ncbi:MAG: hypothetical protein JXB49_33305, partial [Bacteroidales bacterium]|nr:hypothetical protein [Bacteroidales bacterium]
GKITRDDASECMAHIIGALNDLKEMEGRGLMIPFVINTGYIEDAIVREIQKLRDIRIFSKGRENEMFSYLVEIIKSMPVLRIRKKYEHILELFRKDILPVEYGRKFIELATFTENPSWRIAPEDFFTPVRKILESIFWKLREEKIMDERCFSGKEIKLNACIQYIGGYTAVIGLTKFTGIERVPPHIYKLMVYVNEMTSTFSHQYIGETDVSPYALQSVITALCEILYWFKSFMEDLKNKKTK